MAESSQVYKKRSYDAAFKIEFAEYNTNRDAARKYGINLMTNEFVSGRSKRISLGA